MTTAVIVTIVLAIRYSSRTRAGTDQFKHLKKLRYALAGLLRKLGEDLKSGPEADQPRRRLYV